MSVASGLARQLRADTRVSLLAHGAGMLAPLLTIPFLSRVLERSSWGEVLVMQSMAAWLTIALDFGFDLSATNAAAAARGDSGELSRLVSGVQSAKLLMLAATTLVVLAALAVHPLRISDERMLGWAAVFAVARGLNPFWYFQGTGRLQFALVVETFTKIGAAAAVFAFIHGPADGWRVLQIQAMGALLSLVILGAGLWRAHPESRFAVSRGWSSLRMSLNLFVFRLSSGLYNQANSSLMSRVATQSTVAIFGGPDRLVRAATNLLQPITQVLLPRLSHLHAQDLRGAHLEIRRLLWIIGGLGALAGAMFVVGAPLIVRLVFGPGYDDMIPVLRILALLPPITAHATVLGFYWAIPFGHERVIPRAVIAAGMANVAMVPLLVPMFGARGMALSTVIAESIVAATLVVLYVGDRDRILYWNSLT